MHSNPSLAVFSAATLLAAFALSPSPALTEEGEQRTFGLVASVTGEPAARSLTLTLAEGTSQTVTLTEGTRYELDEDDEDGGDPTEEAQEAGFAADPTTLVGRFVAVRQPVDSQQAIAVNVEANFENSGVLQSVTTSRGVKSVKLALPRRQTATFIVNQETLVLVDGEPTSDLTDLKGLVTRVDYDPRTRVATRLEGATGLKRVEGSLVSIVDEALTVSVANRQVSFFLDFFAEVRLDHQPAEVSDLDPRSLVVVDYFEDEAGPAAVALDVLSIEREALTAVVDSVSTTSQTISLRPHDEPSTSHVKPVILKVTAGTEILVNGRRSPLTSIKPGASIQGVFAKWNGFAFAHKVVVRKRGRR